MRARGFPRHAALLTTVRHVAFGSYAGNNQVLITEPEKLKGPYGELPTAYLLDGAVRICDVVEGTPSCQHNFRWVYWLAWL